MESRILAKIKSNSNKYIMYGVLLLLIVVMTVLSEYFLTLTNILNVLRQISITSIIALGMTLVIITGGIDLSVGSILGLTGVVASSYSHPGEYPLIVPILIAMALGALVSFISGFIIAKTGIPPFIVTLGMLEILRGASMLYTSGRPIVNLSEQYKFIGQGTVFRIPVPVIIFAVLVIFMAILLHRTRFGRYVYAVGGNEMAAKLSGINVVRVKIIVYTLIGFLSGISGVILSARTNSGAPNAGVGYELDAIAASVIGGTSMTGGVGTILGTVVGALIVGIVNNGLDLLNVSSYIQSVIKGLIIIMAVLIDKFAYMRRK